MLYLLFATEVSLILGGFSVWSLGVLGQTDNITTPQTVIGALVAGFTMMTGLLVWIVKRLLDTTIPGLQTAFLSALDGQRGYSRIDQENFQKIVEGLQKGFKEDFKLQGDLFEKKLTHEREFFAIQLKILIDGFRDDREKFHLLIEQWKSIPRSKGIQP